MQDDEAGAWSAAAKAGRRWIDGIPALREALWQADAENDALRALLAEARERETRYVLPLYRDENYLARIDRALGRPPP